MGIQRKFINFIKLKGNICRKIHIHRRKFCEIKEKWEKNFKNLLGRDYRTFEQLEYKENFEKKIIFEMRKIQKILNETIGVNKIF